MTDFNLSEKIDVSCPLCPNENINTRDIKEFIKLVKELSFNFYGDYNLSWAIDKLAGEKLK
jgi:hypothetical protein